MLSLKVAVQGPERVVTRAGTQKDYDYGPRVGPHTHSHTHTRIHYSPQDNLESKSNHHVQVVMSCRILS